jgi:hypothetical protein
VLLHQGKLFDQGRVVFIVLQIMAVVLAGVVLQRVPCDPLDVGMSSPPELYVTSNARNKYGKSSGLVRSQRKTSADLCLPHVRCDEE